MVPKMFEPLKYNYIIDDAFALKPRLSGLFPAQLDLNNVDWVRKLQIEKIIRNVSFSEVILMGTTGRKNIKPCFQWK